MRRFGWIAASVVWSIAVFWTVFWLSFPSEALVQRVRQGVPDVLGSDYAVDIASIKPWWMGVNASDVRISKISPVDGTRQPIAILPQVRARTSLLSVLRRAPAVNGSIDMLDGYVRYEVGTAKDDEGRVSLSRLRVTGDGVAVTDVLALAGVQASASGSLNWTLALEGGERGMLDGSGRLEFGGQRLVVSDLSTKATGPIGIEIPLDQILLTADVRQGTVEIERGIVESPLLQATVDGNASLRDPINRTTLDLTVILSEFGEELRPFEGFMASAKHSDGRYHYSCRGILSRIGSSGTCPTPVRDRRSSSGVSRSTGVRAPSPLPQGKERTSATAEREERLRELAERRRLVTGDYDPDVDAGNQDDFLEDDGYDALEQAFDDLEELDDDTFFEEEEELDE